MIHLENDLKIFLQDVLKTSWRCLVDVFAWHLEDALKTSWRRLKDFWPRPIYWSWRCLEDVFWRRKAKASIFVLIKTSFKTSSEDDDEWRLQDVFKTSSSRRMFAGRRLRVRVSFLLFYSEIAHTDSWCNMSLRIQSKYRKIQTRNKSIFGHFRAVPVK